MKRSTKVQALTDMIAPAVAACDVVLWGVEFRPQGKRSLLRVYVDLTAEKRAAADSPETASVGVDDCKRVSHQVSGLLDVHDPIAGEYVLEVSSPGWDRTFFELSQLSGYVDHTIAVRLINAIENRRKMTGKLLAVTDNGIELQLQDMDSSLKISASNIDKANLVFDS